MIFRNGFFSSVSLLHPLGKEMKNKILFEAGSTKTTVMSSHSLHEFETDLRQNEPFQINLSGYNPNRPSTLFEDELQKLIIRTEDEIYFYGSGLNSSANKVKVSRLFQDLFGAKVAVFDDVIGAARAAYSNQRGIVGVLGTGAVVAVYDGQSIQEIRGGWGYLIDDLGGGYELGKVTLSAWLNQSLSDELARDLAKYVGCQREEFVHHFYTNPQLGAQAEGLKMVAGVVTLLSKYQGNSRENKIISDYFKLFFNRHLKQISEVTQIKNVRFIGSVAAVFEPILRIVMQENVMVMDEIVQFPVQKLWVFHFNLS